MLAGCAACSSIDHDDLERQDLVNVYGEWRGDRFKSNAVDPIVLRCFHGGVDIHAWASLRSLWGFRS